QFNLNVQRQFAGSFVVEISGIGNFAHKLPNPNLSINQIDPSVLGAGRSTQAYRPFPQFSNVTILSPTIGDSRYYGAFIRAQKRFSGGFNLVTSYSWSRFFDNSAAGGSSLGQDNGAYSNYYDRRSDWGPASNDIRHRFVFSSVYDLPFGKGR